MAAQDPNADPLQASTLGTDSQNSTVGNLDTTSLSGQNPYKATTGGGALNSVYDPASFSGDALNAKVGTTAGATTYTPDDSALVSSQLTKILSAGSPYIDRARAKAAEYTASRGLQNSSLGAQAGETAAIDAALPIAQQDAQANANAQAANAQAQNTFGLDSNRFVREGALASVNAGYALNQQQQAQNFQAGESAAQRTATGLQFSAQLAADTNLRQQGVDIQAKAQELDAKVRTGQLTLQQAQQQLDQAQRQSSMLADLQKTYLDARLQLETNPNLDANGKANAIQAMSGWFTSNVLQAVKGTLSNPGAWPDFMATAPTGAPAAASEPTWTGARAPEAAPGEDWRLSGGA